jgi:hypothetical protein
MRDDEDDDRSQEYECINVGCAHGEGWTFEAAPEEWYEERGLSTPKNCPDCKAWIAAAKETGAIHAECRFCNYSWSIEATYRIMFHRNTGNWDDYWADNRDKLLCRRCEDYPSRRRQLMYRDAEKKARLTGTANDERAKQKKTESEAEKHSTNLRNRLRGQEINAPKRYDVPTYAEYYRAIPTPEKAVKDHGPNQLTHIMKPGHGWLEKIGTESPETVLNLAHRISNSTADHVLQFTDARMGYTIKYDTSQRICVVIRGDKTSPTRNRLVTVFPKEPEAVFNKVDAGLWR